MRGQVALGSLVLALLLAAAPARAQHTGEALLGDPARKNALSLRVGIDPALGFGLGYLRTLDIRAGGGSRRLGLHVDVAAIFGFSSWDISGGASLRLRQRRGLDVLTTADLRLKVAQNDVHTALVYGYAAALRPGWFDRIFYVGLDLALRGTFAASVFHGAEYRRLFADVADVTYLTDQLSFYAGAAAGVEIGGRVLLGARFAWRFPRTFATYAPYFLPYTIDVDLGLRF